jgi:hypothetical protein
VSGRRRVDVSQAERKEAPRGGIEGVTDGRKEPRMSALRLVTDAAHHVTRHGVERLRQRGFRTGDLDVVLEMGTPAGNAILLTDHDVQKQVAEYRRRIQQLERLRGTAVILAGDRVLSAYRPRRSKVRRFLRERRGRGLGVPRHTEPVRPIEAVLEEEAC